MRESSCPAAGTVAVPPPLAPYPSRNIDALLHAIQRGMWQNAGLLRDAQGLSRMKQALEDMGAQIAPHRGSIELANLHTVAALIVDSALAREESRGAHYRNDFPRRDDANFSQHSVVRSGSISFEPMTVSALAR